MFKKTLIALALTGASVTALAATNTIVGTNVSLEGAAGAASINVPASDVTLAAEYTVNDTVTWTAVGAEFDLVNSAPVFAATLLAGDTATGGLLSFTANSITYRITANTDGAANGVVYTGGAFNLSGMQFTTASVLDATGDINVNYSAQTNTGVALDTATTNDAVAVTVLEQLSSSITTAADGIIDVNNNRTQFTVGPLTDVVVLTPVEAAATYDAVYTGATHVLNGDFSWMDTDATAGVSAGELGAAFAATGGADTYTSVINAAGDAITITVADAAAAATVEAMTMTFTVVGGAAGNVLPAQTFTVDSTIAYDTDAGAAATKVTATAGAAGAWTLNGSVVTVPYIPFGPVTQPIIRHTNTGVQSGDITMRYMVEGTHTTWQTVAAPLFSSAAPGVRNMLAEIDAALAGEGFDSSTTGFKVALEITSNTPAADVNIFVGAKVTTSTSDRLSIGNF